jgi:hypothetical protein
LEQALEPQDKRLHLSQDLLAAAAAVVAAAKAAVKVEVNLQVEAVVLLHFMLNNLSKGIFYEK